MKPCRKDGGSQANDQSPQHAGDAVTQALGLQLVKCTAGQGYLPNGIGKRRPAVVSGEPVARRFPVDVARTDWMADVVDGPHVVSLPRWRLGLGDSA